MDLDEIYAYIADNLLESATASHIIFSLGIFPERGAIRHVGACGVHSVDTKSEIVKILHFKQFYKHYVFNEDGDGGRKKVLKNYIDVYVCIDMVCGDTKNDLGSEE